jgi:type II secretory pathway pseudopilin PulG
MRRVSSLSRLLLAVAIILIAIALLPRGVGESDVFRRETRAIAAIRSIHTAEMQYYSQYGHYAESPSELAPMICDGLERGTAGGYSFALCATAGRYVIRAASADNRTFYSDQGMIVRANNGLGPATACSSEFR